MSVSKAHVSFASSATFEGHKLLAIFKKVCNYVATLCVTNDCACGHFDDKIFSTLACAIFCATRSAVFCTEMLFELEINESVHIFVCDKDDVTAIATITTIRATVGNVLFSMERHGAIATVACLDEDFYVI